jgi:hypothetical protein
MVTNYILAAIVEKEKKSLLHESGSEKKIIHFLIP